LLVKDAAINAHTTSVGRGGDVTVHAGSLIIDGSDMPGSFCGIAADSIDGATGAAGNMNITVDESFKILTGEVTSSTAGGNGGNVSIRAGSLLIDGSAAIATVAEPGATGNAGNINITLSGGLRLVSSGQISSSTQSNGNGGTVNV